MPPPRRPRDRLARALRATADRLSGPASPGSPDRADSPGSLGSPGSPGDVPRPPGQPPEHWRRLVEAHAPGLLRDLPPPPVEHGPLTDPSANAGPDQTPVRRSRTARHAVVRLWRGWTALLADRFGTSRSRTRSRHEADPGSPSRSWYESAPIGAASYQDLPQLLEGGTGISGVEKPEPRGAALPRPGAAVTRAGGGEGAAGSETAPAMVDARCRSGDAVRPDDAGSREGPPPCGCVTSNGPAGSPGPARSACIADGSGSRDALGTSGIRGTPAAGTGATATDTATATETTGTAGTGRTAEARTSARTSADPDGSRDAIGSPGRVTSVDSASPSTPERWPSLGAGRVDALRNLAQIRRGRARHRDDAAGADLSPDRGDVLPLVFAAAPPSLPHGPAAHTRGGRTGPANCRGGTGDGSVADHPGRAAGSPYPDGHDPAPGGEFRARQLQRPARPPSGSPWPVLPDDAGPARTTNPAGAARAADGGAYADPWPVLPAEPVWLPTRTPWGDTARLDREQAGD
ncbi:hypothetical protein Micau_3529 [Micromonospora aurantiaca ATCC 27029]|nr:hypothetical protein Micau_3529 [Micromonospora aurantiaca ATCC 27029]